MGMGLSSRARIRSAAEPPKEFSVGENGQSRTPLNGNILW